MEYNLFETTDSRIRLPLGLIAEQGIGNGVFIFGEKGVGKTTLAEKIKSELCPEAEIVEDIQEVSAKGQKEIIRIIHKQPLIVTSNENFMRYVENGKILFPIFTRLAKNLIEIPPLRERKRDLLLAIDKFNRSNKKKINSELESTILVMNLENNYRELHSIFSEVIKSNHSNIAIKSNTDNQIDLIKNVENDGLTRTVEKFEKHIVKRVLRENEGKVNETIKKLKISKSVFYRIQGD